MSKKNTTEIWDVFYEKTQHGDLDIVNGHPSMFLFFAFVMIHVRGGFFWRIFEFFQDFDLAAHFLAFLSKKLSPGEILMLFRKLTYWSSLKSQFKASVSCKRSTFWSFYQENRRKMQKWRKNPAHAIFRITNVTDTLDRFECISLGFSISWIHHNLSEYTFHLHRNYLYSHWEWLFLREFEKILRRKVRF